MSVCQIKFREKPQKHFSAPVATIFLKNSIFRRKAKSIFHVENIEDLAILIQETKNQTLEPPDLIQINAILAHDLKKLQEDLKKQKMEKLCKRFPHLAGRIFDQVNDESLNKCKEVSGEMLEYLEKERFFWIRIIKVA